MKRPLRGRLWRHPDFLKLWTGETVSRFGTQVSPVGSFLGGVFGSGLGVIQTILIGGAISTLAALWIVLGPVIHVKEQPAPVAA
jgi:hypothetical protein